MIVVVLQQVDAGPSRCGYHDLFDRLRCQLPRCRSRPCVTAGAGNGGAARHTADGRVLSRGLENGDALARHVTSSSMVMSAERVILVTGGGGFIGNRFVEVIHLTGFGRVRVGVRRWASAARAARFPIEIVLCDVLDDRQIAAAMHGVDVVVHCAVGDERVIVEGTRNVLEAGRAQSGVARASHQHGRGVRPGCERARR